MKILWVKPDTLNGYAPSSSVLTCLVGEIPTPALNEN
jgi:hypothetical protein